MIIDYSKKMKINLFNLTCVDFSKTYSHNIIVSRGLEKIRHQISNILYLIHDTVQRTYTYFD